MPTARAVAGGSLSSVPARHVPLETSHKRPKFSVPLVPQPQQYLCLRYSSTVILPMTSGEVSKTDAEWMFGMAKLNKKTERPQPLEGRYPSRGSTVCLSEFPDRPTPVPPREWEL
jgi:hypothetical protein